MDHAAAQGYFTVMTTSGPLDGLAILRFAHAFESGGGTERYLDDLNRALLARNAMTIIQIQLTRNPTAGGPIEIPSGKGRLILIPLTISTGNEGQSSADEHTLRYLLKQWFRDFVIYNPLIWRLGTARWTASYRLKYRPGQAVGAGPAAAEMLRSHQVDLVMLHFFGGADADDVITAARLAAVPYTVLNHYSNDRFLHLAIRKHAMLANGVAGVNSLGLPRHVRNGFANLSDGIDTDFFRCELARPLENPPSEPILLLPARIVREKGQLDLVRAAVSLHKAGIPCCVAFAGRSDSSGFIDELRSEIHQAGMAAYVHFLGSLNLEQLRDWYAASSIVVLPTYHHEGLPRVILEAQAMGRPVVAYAMGGMEEGVASGKTGYLLRPGDYSGLAGRLRELLLSPSLREVMGACGRKEAEARFSLTALADRHERFYAQVIAGFNKPAVSNVAS